MGFQRFCLFLSLLIFTLYVGLFLSLFYFFDKRVFLETLISERTLFSIKISLIAATLASFFSLILAIPAGFALSRYEFRGKRLVDTIMEFPLVVSPAALGAIILIFFNNPLGVWIQKNLVEFVYTFYGILLAQFVTVLGMAVRFMKATMDSISPRYELVSYSLGVNPWTTFFKVTLPLASRGILATWILTWAKALGEFGATITVAGSMAMRTETLPIAIFMRLATADIEGSVALILILLSLALSTLYAFRIILKRRTDFS